MVMMLMMMVILNATREYVTTFAFLKSFILRVVSATIQTDLVSFPQPIEFRNVSVADTHLFFKLPTVYLIRFSLHVF